LAQGIGEWPENQILIPDWTYFHYPGATLIGEWPENQIRSNVIWINPQGQDF
jgi:hypothetical protein